MCSACTSTACGPPCSTTTDRTRGTSIIFPLGKNPVVRRRRDGRFDLVLDPGLRTVVRDLLGELDELIAADPGAEDLRRLNPPAYLDDPERDAAYRLLAGDELLTARHATIDAVLSTLDEERLTEDQLWSWLQAINALRLVVGTRLDISEDDHRIEVADDDPAAPMWAIYEFGTWLQYQVLRALGA